MMHQAEMLVNNKVFPLGNFLSNPKSSIGTAWTRAITVADDDIQQVACWAHGESEPAWWAQKKYIIKLEEKAHALRAKSRKPELKSEAREAIKKQIIELEAEIKKLKKAPKRAEVAKPQALKFGQMVTCRTCGIKQRYTEDNTSCYECKKEF